MLRFALISLVLLSVSCTTTPTKSSSSRKIIDQSAGQEGLPAWASKGNRFKDADGRVAFKGFLTMDTDSRPEACTHAAGVEAKGRIASLVASSILDESGISGADKTLVYNRLTAVLAKQKLSGVEIADEYWMLVEIRDDEKATRRLECYAKVTIEQGALDKAIKRASDEIGKDPAVKEHQVRLQDAEERLRKSEGLDK